METTSELHLDGQILEREESDGLRRITLRLVKFGEVTKNTLEGITETFKPGAFKDVDITKVHLEAQSHGGPIVGIGESLRETAEDAIATFRVASTAAGEELWTLAKEGILTSASVVFSPVKWDRQGEVYAHESVNLRRVAVLPHGAYPSAQVLSVREEVIPESVEDSVSESVNDSEETSIQMDNIELLERVDALDAKVSAIQMPNVIVKRDTLSLGEYMTRNFNAGDPELKRALAFNTMADQDGLEGTTSIKDVKRIIAEQRPFISAVGTTPLPDSGTLVTWPLWDGALGASNYVDNQSAEAATIQSTKLIFGTGQATITTFAGGSATTFQARDRSEPSFTDAAARLYVSAWARRTENAIVSAVASGYGGGSSYVNITNDSTGAAFTAALFAASADVQVVTGAPASVVVVGTGLFKKLGGKSLIVQAGALSNAVGSTDAASLRMAVSGLTIVHAPRVSSMHGFVTNRQALTWFEDGPFSVTSTDVEHLAQNNAIYSYGAAGLFIPAGIVRIETE